MGKLDDDLKKLHAQKLKAEFLKLLRTAVGDVSDPKFKTIEKDVKDEVFAFFDAQIDMIESGEIRNSQELDTLFSTNEIEVLKIIVQRATKNGIETTEPTGPYSKETPTTETPKPTPKTEMSTPDKISFALEYRHLGGKTVKVKSHDGASGEVTGIDAPNIVVHLANGQYVYVPPEDLIV